MRITQVLAGIPASDFAASGDFYRRLLGRPADRTPMDGCSEWELVSGGWLQLVAAPETAGHTSVTVGIDDADAFAAGLADSGVPFDGPLDVPSGQFRLVTVEDPDGNTLVFAQALTPGA